MFARDCLNWADREGFQAEVDALVALDTDGFDIPATYTGLDFERYDVRDTEPHMLE